MNITILGLTSSDVNLKRMHQLYNIRQKCLGGKMIISGIIGSVLKWVISNVSGIALKWLISDISFSMLTMSDIRHQWLSVKMCNIRHQLLSVKMSDIRHQWHSDNMSDLRHCGAVSKYLYASDFFTNLKKKGLVNLGLVHFFQYDITSGF